MKKAYVIYERLEFDIHETLLPSRYMFSGDYTGSDEEICETLFREWNNAGGPTGQKSGPWHVRSMCVGDRVLIQEGTNQRKYRCVAVGFELEDTADRVDLEKTLPVVTVDYHSNRFPRFKLQFRVGEQTVVASANRQEEAFHLLGCELAKTKAPALTEVLCIYECGRCRNTRAVQTPGGSGTCPCPDCRVEKQDAFGYPINGEAE